MLQDEDCDEEGGDSTAENCYVIQNKKLHDVALSPIMKEEKRY